MTPFTYARPDAVAPALNDIAVHDLAKFIAGGTNLLDLMKVNVERPDRLIDINRLPLSESSSGRDGSLTIGALVTIRIPPIIPKSNGATRCCPRRFSREHRPNCTTWQQPAEI